MFLGWEDQVNLSTCDWYSSYNVVHMTASKIWSCYYSSALCISLVLTTFWVKGTFGMACKASYKLAPLVHLWSFLFQPWPFERQPHLTYCNLSSVCCFLTSRPFLWLNYFSHVSRPGNALAQSSLPLVSFATVPPFHSEGHPGALCACFIQAKVPQHCNCP